MCCARIGTTTNGNTQIAYVNAYEYFYGKLLRPQSFDWNWDFQQYHKLYVASGGPENPLRNDPQLKEECWDWRRVLPAQGVYPQRVILCCPEDVRCSKHCREAHALCRLCEIPLCRSCFSVSRRYADNGRSDCHTYCLACLCAAQ